MKSKFFLTWVATSIALYFVPYLVDQIRVSGLGVSILFSFFLGLVNTIIRPIFIIITAPFIILTLGIFLLFINGALIYVLSWFFPGVYLASFWGAVVASILVSILSWVCQSIISKLLN